MAWRRWIVGLTLAFVVVGAVALVLEREEAPVPPSSSTSPVTAQEGITFDEAPAEFVPAELGTVKFFSLTLSRADGFESFMVSGGTDAGKGLAQAVRAAEPVEPADFPSPSAAAPGAPSGSGRAHDLSGSTLTVVLPDRRTLTFSLDLERDLLVRGEAAYALSTDLSALVENVAGGGREGSDAPPAAGPDTVPVE